MKPTQMLLVTVGLMTIGFQAVAAPIVTFTLSPPDGLLAGAAGTTVGWGYTISTTSDFVTIEGIAFGDLTPVGTFSTPGLPSTAASPGSPFVVPFFMNVSGLQYDISATALVGTATQGVMTLTYDAFSDAGLTNQIVFSDTVNAQLAGNDVLAEVDVAPAQQNVPEPASASLIGIGCALFAAGWMARRSS